MTPKLLMKDKKAILWDNDGVLVDTEKLFFKATKEVLAEVRFDFTKEMFVETVLVESYGPWHNLRKNGSSDDEILKLKRKRNSLYKKYLESNDLLINGVKKIVFRLSKKYEMCIVTSSTKEHFDRIHAKTDLLKYFRFVLTCEDYKNPKPNPEPYILAAKLIGYPQEQCIVIEDSRRGLMASVGASIECIVVPNSFTEKSDFKEAIIVLDKIEEIERILL